MKEFARGDFFSATTARTSEIELSLIAQMASCQGYKHIFQSRGVSAKLGERNILPRQFSEQRGHGGVKFAYLQEHSPILGSYLADALDPAQRRYIERMGSTARCKLDHLFRAVRGD